MKRNIYTILFAAGLCGLASAALAQMPPGAHPHAWGHPMAMLEAVKAQLNLNTSQQQQWDNAVTQGKTARDAARANFGTLKSAMQAELAKTEPDFSAVAAVADDVEQKNSALRKQARNAWLALYATFTPEQKAVARDAIKAKLNRMEHFRARLRERLGG